MKVELGRINRYYIEDGKLICISDNGTLEITFLERSMIYVSYHFNSFDTPPSLLYVNDILKGEVEKTDKEILLSSDDKVITALSGDNKIIIELDTSNITVLYKDKVIYGGRLGTNDTVIPRIEARAFRKEGDKSWFCRINDPRVPDSRYYGMGDKAGVPDRSGKRVRIYNRDSLGYDGETSDPLYKSIAFYIKENRENKSVAGFYYPEGLINAVDFGKESPFYTYVEIEDGPAAYYIIPGDDYKEVLASYCTITGFPAFPPLFSFGFFGSSMNYVESDDARERILNYFARTEKEKIPCEGMYVSSGYLKADDGKRYALYWNTRKFPDYGEYLKSLRKRGYNLTMNIKPGFLTTHPWYDELEKKGYFLKDDKGDTLVDFYWGGSASFLDFANEEAFLWWKNQLKDKYLSHGCTGIWNDNNECEVEDIDTDSYRRKLIYPLLMCRASSMAFKEMNPEKRPWIYTRAACPGIQKYARSWTGDNTSTWKTLKYNQYQIMSLGLSGMPYIGNDLGGFYGERPSEELLVRSSQSAVFQARFVIHSWREDDKPTEPWTYPGALPIIKDLVEMHYYFMPYIYNEAYRASLTGTPMCRVLALEYPEDSRIPVDLPLYQSGDSVLPLFTVDEGKKNMNIYLPEGTEWYDPMKEYNLEGGKEHLVNIPYGTARYLFRVPSVIPTSPGCSTLTTGRFRNLKFILVPSEEEYEYTYFEDDGESTLESDDYTLIRIRMNGRKADFEVIHGSLPLNGRRFTAELSSSYMFPDYSKEKEIVFHNGKATIEYVEFVDDIPF